MADERGPRELAYDTHMAPLIDRLIAVAREHKIPLFVHAALDGTMMCTTNIPDGQTVRESRQAGWMLDAAKGRLAQAVRIHITEYADIEHDNEPDPTSFVDAGRSRG